MGRAAGESADLFRTLRALVGPAGRIYWALGADVACGMRFWRDKVEECTRPGETCDGLLIFRREGADEEQVRQVLSGLQCDVEIIGMPAPLRRASSHRARLALVQAAADAADAADGGTGGNHGLACSDLMPSSVSDYCLAQPWLLEMYQAQLRELGERPEALSDAEAPRPPLVLRGHAVFLTPY